MARPRTELQTILEDLTGVKKAYFQADQNTNMEYPCIEYHRFDSAATFADNIKYRFKKGYMVTVLDYDPDSLIPDQVENLPLTRSDRFYVVDGLNHFVFKLFF